MNERQRRAGYARLALERQAKQRAEEERKVFVASLGHGFKPLKGKTFTELGEQLVVRGYRMTKARQTARGLRVPHRDPDHKPAYVRQEIE